MRERRIGIPKDQLGPIIIARPGRDTDTYGRLASVFPKIEGSGHLISGRVASLYRCLASVDTLNQHRELVSAEPCDVLAVRKERPEPACYLKKKLVADRMPEAIVYQLETVEIQITNRKVHAFASLNIPEGDLQPVQEQCSI